MRNVKFAVLAGLLVAAAGAGAAFIPSVEAQTPTPRARVAPRAYQFGGASGGEIGVSIRDVEGQDVKGAASGVLVAEVTAGGPAEKAGVKSGDVFVEFDGERVRSARQFTRLVQETPPGRKVQASVLRDGQKVSVSIEPREGSGFAYRLLGDLANTRVFDTLGDDIREMIPPPPPPAPAAPPAPPAPPRPFGDFESFIWRAGNTLGVTTSELSPQLAEYFGTKEGLLVSSVAADSAAAKAGVKAGDVITTFNGVAVESSSELRRAIQRLDDGAEFTIGVMRDKKGVTLKGKMESARNRRTFRS